MKICTLKYCGAFTIAAKIAGLLPYGAFALQPCPHPPFPAEKRFKGRVPYVSSLTNLVQCSRSLASPPPAELRFKGGGGENLERHICTVTLPLYAVYGVGENVKRHFISYMKFSFLECETKSENKID